MIQFYQMLGSLSIAEVISSSVDAMYNSKSFHCPSPLSYIMSLIASELGACIIQSTLCPGSRWSIVSTLIWYFWKRGGRSLFMLLPLSLSVLLADGQLLGG